MRDERGRTDNRRGADNRAESRDIKAVDAPRRAAFDALVAVESRDAYANLILPNLLRERGIIGRDAALVTELVYGTLRARGFLDAVIAITSDRPSGEVDPRVMQLLRLGAYQLLYTRIPSHAAVSTTVNVARVAVTEGPSKFVNAVLRRISEKDEETWKEEVVPAAEEDDVRRIAIIHSHPEWIVRAVQDALGAHKDELEAAVEANNIRPSVHLAVRPGRIERDVLASDVEGKAGQYSPYAVYLPGGDPGKLDSVRKGHVHVQDEGSQLAALALANAPLTGSDSRWLDLCAGPGGKAALLGGLAEQRGATITAVEVSEHRSELVRRAVSGFPVAVVTADGRTVGENEQLPAETFDRVLVDAPCTGLGALRRRPEARWRRQPSDIPPLTKLQRELLKAAIRATRPGGIIAYVTCSPHIAETRVIVAEALRKEAVTQVDAKPYFPGVPQLGDAPTVQLWPHRHSTDAMFIALLRKNL